MAMSLDGLDRSENEGQIDHMQ